MELPLYWKIGGASAVEAAVDRFYQRVWSDPVLSPYFPEVGREALKVHQHQFLSAALDGPQGYKGRPLREAHAPLNISDDIYDRVVGHLVATLEELDVDTATIQEITVALEALRSEVVQDRVSS